MKKSIKLKSDTYYNVCYFAKQAADTFCKAEEKRFTNLTDVHSVNSKEEFEIIGDADGNTFYNITSFISPIRIFYTIGNVARAKEYPVQPLYENEEFIAAVKIFNAEKANYSFSEGLNERERLENEAFRILFGEKLEFTVEEKRIINEELTMAI